MDQPLTIHLPHNARRKLERIAADMGRTPEDLSVAILSEWALTITQNLDQGIRRPVSPSKPDFIHLGLLLPQKEKDR